MNDKPNGKPLVNSQAAAKCLSAAPRTSTANPDSTLDREGRRLQAVFAAATALFVGIGIPTDAIHTRGAMIMLTCGLLCSLAGLVIPGTGLSAKWGYRVLLSVMAIGMLVQCAFIILHSALPLPPDTVWTFSVGSAAAGILGALGLLRSQLARYLRISGLAVIFLILSYSILRAYSHPLIDVFMFQTRGATLLLRGGNSYDSKQVRYPNTFPKGVESIFYGRDVVDFTPTASAPNGTLRYGFPYLPVSLLLVLPGQIFGGDVRYSDIAAILLSALLMAFARPGRHGPLAAGLFLFTPAVFYVVRQAWTEPLLVLTFSLAMFCACRLPRMLPYALGLFLATKQYTVLLVPLVPLLAGAKDRSFRDTLRLLIVAAITAAAVTLPFALWNFHEFWRDVIEWQLIQPFREDSLSYLTTIASHLNGWRPPFWVPFVVVIPAIAIVLWRGARTPSGFATGATFVFLVFFLFNKQSFTNYYYFVIGAACWSVAAAGIEDGRANPLSPIPR